MGVYVCVSVCMCVCVSVCVSVCVCFIVLKLCHNNNSLNTTTNGLRRVATRLLQFIFMFDVFNIT